MPKAARSLSSLVQEAEASEFKTVVLFSCGGLLFSLLIVLARMNGIF